MDNPQISIIVPVYKVEAYLDECVQSILSQSFKDFELILVDDGSPDNCPALCDSYAKQDERVVALHKPNGGLSDARNYGLDRSKGKYIAFVDSDDIIAEGALEALYNEIVEKDADIVLGKVIRFVVGGGTRPYTRLEERKVIDGKEALTMLLQGRKINISMCGALYKREIWEDIRMPKGYICEDWYTTPSLYLSAEKVIYSPKLWYLYRDNPDSIMGAMQKKANPQVIQVAEHVISTIRQTDEKLYEETLWSNMKRVWKYVGIIYARGSVKQEREFLTQTRSFLKKYYSTARTKSTMSTAEKIGVWSFCYCEPLCSLLYKIKR